MKKLKVMTVVGTRPEIIRLVPSIQKLDSSKAVEHVLVHTGQNHDYELNQVFFEDFNLRKPDYFLNSVTSGKPMETIGNILIKIDEVLDKEKPEAFLVLGDTNSCLCAIAAKKRKVPVFHMEAGNRCYDSRVPEELNRKIVDHISDINMPYSDIARECLLREGFPAQRIIKTGSPMFEVLQMKKDDIQKSDVVERLSLMKDRYFVVSAHREENVSDRDSFLDLMESLNAVAELYKLPIIFSTHPRTKKIIEKESLELNPLIQIMKPLGFSDYVNLQLNSKVVLSDSGTISEESAILGFKALNIRYSHERHEAMEEGSVMMVGLKKDRILQGLTILNEESEDRRRLVADYSIPNVSDKVLKVILSYSNYAF
ncbi:UDP-N-acetylglucosamine 2-epimerase (non-hydrolysing) [Allofrancisella inopinata]|uniref:UDP-N-acetylglucosamine 2-epimerase (Non-hydrolyzing) n=1 Tax=Allofrancisella inopinata TaxID=1085647 RepID=A0AAE7CRI1_9GAMM|nr:UDP-N-acetylglucosamine 2-epimerase (non-hydrolyzing) [Allofrancisella inopinata]QIV95703.1 UDP-N-acetylglucosamine 2-epimerase (non-hydrolyzing) [Allofrancisella inopinata]TDT72161.1 UDP-N-acetylglucosamine 2-epimerase (non-hydrolysing) [Allofrancisella inopinata]